MRLLIIFLLLPFIVKAQEQETYKIPVGQAVVMVTQSKLDDSTAAIRARVETKQPTGNYIVAGSTFNYAADAGANDSYSITLNPAPASYQTGMVIFFKANTVNTGSASINVNGLGAKTIVKRVNTTLANGDIPSQSICMIIYDGTNFKLLNPVVN